MFIFSALDKRGSFHAAKVSIFTRMCNFFPRFIFSYCRRGGNHSIEQPCRPPLLLLLARCCCCRRPLLLLLARCCYCSWPVVAIAAAGPSSGSFYVATPVATSSRPLPFISLATSSRPLPFISLATSSRHLPFISPATSSRPLPFLSPAPGNCGGHVIEGMALVSLDSLLSIMVFPWR